MISQDMLYALLQGLPATHFNYLPDPWPIIAMRITVAFEKGRGLVEALTEAFEKATSSERRKIMLAFRQVWPVMLIPGLSYRQREALIVLRTLKTASLAQLNCILAQDRSNLHRCLRALIRKGLVFKFYKPEGVVYFAVQKPLSRSEKRAVARFLKELASIAFEDEMAAASPAGRLTTPTTRTTQTIPTALTTSKTPLPADVART